MLPVIAGLICSTKIQILGVVFILFTMLITKLFSFVGGFLGATIGMLSSLVYQYWVKRGYIINNAVFF